MERLSVRVSQSKTKIEELQGVLALHQDRLSRETEDYAQYQKIKRDGESEAKQTKEKRNKRKAAER